MMKFQILFYFSLILLVMASCSKKETIVEKPLTTQDYVDVAQAAQALDIQKEAEGYGVNSNYSLVIPKIEAYSNVVANVDTASEAAYEAALKRGVAHAAGTHFPGQGQMVYMFSHSTDASYNIARYNAVFYLLRKLEPGDQIITYFADKKYEYKVTEKVVVPADDTSWYTDPREGEHLVLQTCDPPGTTWKRLLVIAEPVN